MDTKFVLFTARIDLIDLNIIVAVVNDRLFHKVNFIKRHRISKIKIFKLKMNF